jgi:peptide-methionine (R)-S-oxide reductase
VKPLRRFRQQAVGSNGDFSHEMKGLIELLLGLSICIWISACSRAVSSNFDAAQIRTKLAAIPLDHQVDFTNKEWQVIMSPEQFYVMRRAGTERPSLNGNALDHRNGIYVCSACGNPLYRAETKFNSGTGWPSFWQPIRKEAVRESRTFSAIFGGEISCARCGSHLGHVFKDGPPPTGLRYCMNAVALTYREASTAVQQSSSTPSR